MAHTGTYEELLRGSDSFSRLLENIHQEKQQQLESASSNELRRFSRCPTIPEADSDELSSPVADLESAQSGSVKWSVYISYVRTGVGLTIGIFLILLLFGVREATSILYSCWLAQWSEEEDHRHRNFSNCAEVNSSIVSSIKSMDSIEWNHYKERKFLICAGS